MARKYSSRMGGLKIRRKRVPKSAQKSYVKAVCKEVIRKNIETKLINCPNSNIFGTTFYTANQGLFYLAKDVFAMQQGPQNSSSISSSTANRIGDKIRAVGFMLNYDLAMPNIYSVGSTTIMLGYVKFRVVVYTQAFGVPALSYSQVFDGNFNTGGTYTQQPINFQDGFVKRVLWDKTYVIKTNTGVAPPVVQTPYTNVFQLRKYIKYDKIIEYCENQIGSAQNSTREPIFVVLTAEYDTPNTVTPTGTSLLSVNGYTCGWFKDA